MFSSFKPKNIYIKRINVQFKVDFTKGGTSNVTIQTIPNIYHYGVFIYSGIGN